jgi:hypothetical protein
MLGVGDGAGTYRRSSRIPNAEAARETHHSLGVSVA